MQIFRGKNKLNFLANALAYIENGEMNKNPHYRVSFQAV